MIDGSPIDEMTFVTTLRLQSGDRAALDAVVDDIRTTAEQKGAELTGPHSRSPDHRTVPQYADVTGDRTLGTWSYTVYRREMELVGHETLARQIAGWEFPDAVRVEVEVSSM